MRLASVVAKRRDARELHNFECRPYRVTYTQAAEGRPASSRRRLRYEIFKVDVSRYIRRR